jgi:hypothetical protein
MTRHRHGPLTFLTTATTTVHGRCITSDRGVTGGEGDVLVDHLPAPSIEPPSGIPLVERVSPSGTWHRACDQRVAPYFRDVWCSQGSAGPDAPGVRAAGAFRAGPRGAVSPGGRVVAGRGAVRRRLLAHARSGNAADHESLDESVGRRLLDDRRERVRAGGRGEVRRSCRAAAACGCAFRGDCRRQPSLSRLPGAGLGERAACELRR